MSYSQLMRVHMIDLLVSCFPSSLFAAERLVLFDADAALITSHDWNYAKLTY